MEIQNLPMFKELSRVFCSYRIESWQTVDFWDKVKLLKVVDSNVNYKSVYRLILRMVKEGYLIIDVGSKYEKTTYTEIEKLQILRLQFCRESVSTLEVLDLKKCELECSLTELLEEVNTLNNLKEILTNLQFKIEQIIVEKNRDVEKLKAKVSAMRSLIFFLKKDNMSNQCLLKIR